MNAVVKPTSRRLVNALAASSGIAGFSFCFYLNFYGGVKVSFAMSLSAGFMAVSTVYLTSSHTNLSRLRRSQDQKCGRLAFQADASTGEKRSSTPEHPTHG